MIRSWKCSFALPLPSKECGTRLGAFEKLPMFSCMLSLPGEGYAFIRSAVRGHTRIFATFPDASPRIHDRSRNLRCPYEWLDPAEFQIRHYRSKSLEEYVQRRAGSDSAYKSKIYTREQLALEWEATNSQCGKEGTSNQE